MGRSKFPRLLLHFVERVLHRGDVNDFSVCDFGPPEDRWESLLCRIQRLLDPDFFVALAVGPCDLSRTTKEIDRTNSMSAYRARGN